MKKINLLNNTYKVVAYEKRELGDRYKKVYAEEFNEEEDAYKVAREVARRISDVYGLSYVEVIDTVGDLLTEITGPYDSDANSDLSKFNAKDFLRK